MTSFLFAVVYISCFFFRLGDSCTDGNFSVCFEQVSNSSSSANSKNISCYSDLHSLKTLTSSTVVTACKKEYALSFVISVIGASNIEFEGAHGHSIFRCNTNAGMQLLNSNNITFHRITFAECGHKFCRALKKEATGVCNDTITASMFFFNSSGIRFHEISITNGTGAGVVLINTAGHFSHCNFSNNSMNKITEEPGGGGMHIEVDNRHAEANYLLEISNCMFSNNTSDTPSNIEGISCDYQTPVPLGLKGGGLGIFLRKSKSEGEMIITINSSAFSGNSGKWGGGIYLQYCTSTGNATVSIMKTKFLYNEAQEAGGGLDIGFQQYPTKDHIHDNVGNNSLYCNSCLFELNKSYLGGGTAMFTDEFTYSGRNSLTFTNSSWHKNKAHYGMAIDLAPRLINTPQQKYLIDVLFIDVIFSENFKLTCSCLHCHKSSKRYSSFQNTQSGGILLATGLKVGFQKALDFNNNKDSAIYAVSTILEFHRNTDAIFISNQALSGAAIALIGFSAIHVDFNVTINMINNSASAKGGAIYHESISKHDYTFSRTCFIQLMNTTEIIKHTGIHFNFIGNKAGSSASRDGNSIFATTLNPCMRYYSHLYFNQTTADQVFSGIGNFHYDQTTDQAIATRPRCMTATGDKELKATPGYSIDLLFNNTDDLNEEVQGVYNIKSTGNIEVDKKSVFTSLKAVTLNGPPGSQGNIIVTNVDRREATITFKVKLQHCPPFFVYSPTTGGKCECYSNSNYNYNFLFRCSPQNGSSSIVHGYWIGTYNSTEEVYYAYCPHTYCFRNDEKVIHALPKMVDDVSRTLCDHSGRSGPLCGQCKENYSAHYHSDSLLCGSEKTCSYGWLLYIVAEIIPMTLFFFVIIICRINFMSGPLNGFLFFSQAYVSMYKIGESFIFIPSHSKHLVKAIQVSYKFFNLDFFGVDALSFCLWKGATSLQMLAFTYLTVVIGFFLVIGTVYALNRFMILNKLLNYQNMTSSVTHGLSTFLVMIYVRLTSVSVDILHYKFVNNLDRTISYAVVFYQGNVRAFSSEHAPFALLAITFLIPVTLIPPVLLTAYPLCLKLAGLRTVNKLKLCSRALSRIPMSKLKPMFDTFQGSFKDNRRYCSGIYFVYRVVLLLTTLLPRVSLTLVILQIELTLMLILHALCWPYIKRVHNIVDGLLFANLCVINILSLLNQVYSKHGNTYIGILSIATDIKIFLIVMPLLCLCGYTITSVWKTFRRKTFRVQTFKVANDEISMSMIDSREGSVAFDYKNFQNDSYMD